MTDRPLFFSGNRQLAPLVFLFSLECALLGLNPTFYMDDSPEFTTCAASLGVAHPPGYPLYILLGRLMSLLPLPICFVQNLLSALLASLVSVLIFLLLNRDFKVPAVISFCFALAWMAGITSYPAALSSKRGVYELTAVFLLAILSSLLRGKAAQVVFFFGLSLGNHWMSMAAYAPGLALLAYQRTTGKIFTGDPKSCPLTVRTLGNFLFICLLGLSVYLYLPLRAVNHPLVNWGSPSHWTAFHQHLSRHVDQGRDLSSDPGQWLKYSGLYLFSCVKEFSGLGLLALLGLFFEWRTNLSRAFAMTASWGGLMAAVSVFSKFSSEKFFLFQDYSISSMVFVILFSALGIRGLSRLWGETRNRKLLLGAVLAALTLAGLFFRINDSGEAYFTYTYDQTLNAWKSTPRNALFFCQGDNYQFPCWYLQWIVGKRPDLGVVGSSLTMDWYREQLAKSHPDLKVLNPQYEPDKIYVFGPLTRWMVENNPDKSFYFTYTPGPEEEFSNMNWAPLGLTREGTPSPRKPVFQAGLNDLFWDNIRLRHARKGTDPIDQRTWDNVLWDYGFCRYWLAQYEIKQAGDLESITPIHGKTKTSVMAKGWYERSLANLLWTNDWEPGVPEHSLDVGANYLFLGDLDHAREWVQKANQRLPRDAEIYYDAGVMAYNCGSFFPAKNLFLKAVEMDPTYDRPRQALHLLERKP